LERRRRRFILFFALGCLLSIVWVPITSSMSRDKAILVNQSTEPIRPLDS
jgi:hypothetical protein